MRARPREPVPPNIKILLEITGIFTINSLKDSKIGRNFSIP